jgi:hypothetical protein
MGFVVDEVALGQIVSEYFGFPALHRLLHNPSSSSSSYGAGTVGQTVAAVPSGLSLTPLVCFDMYVSLPLSAYSTVFAAEGYQFELL